MFILIRDTHHRHAISLRPGVVVYVRVVVVCEGYPYSDQHPARRRLSLLLSRSRQQESPSLLRPAQRSRHYTPSRPSETMQRSFEFCSQARSDRRRPVVRPPMCVLAQAQVTAVPYDPQREGRGAGDPASGAQSVERHLVVRLRLLRLAVEALDVPPARGVVLPHRRRAADGGPRARGRRGRVGHCRRLSRAEGVEFNWDLHESTRRRDVKKCVACACTRR